MDNDIFEINTIEKFALLSLELQRKMLSRWNDEYYNKDNPSVTDEFYDACLAIYNKRNKQSFEYLGDASEAFEKYNHTYPILSLGKINKKEDFKEYVKKFSPEKENDDWHNPILEPKIDGLTVVYYPDGKFVSRGDGHVGEVLPWVKYIPGMPQEPPTRPVRMEIYISKENFKKYFADSNKNSRNMAAGILRRKNYTNDIKHLSYVAYNIYGDKEEDDLQLIWLEAIGYNIVPYINISNDNVEEIFNMMEEWSKNLPYDTDGVVLKVNRYNAGEIYGSTEHHPNNMIAYKFKSAVESTTLRSIEWSYGKNKVTPVAVFDPVELGGTTVSRASLHNLNIMRSLNIKIGREVLVTKKNEIIPQIIYCDSNKPDNFSNIKCPKCGTILKEKDNGELYCDNVNCNGSVLEDALRMSSKEGLDIQGLSEQTWIKILSEKVKITKNYNPFEIIIEAQQYIKKPTDIERPYGLTKKVWTKICNSIINSATDVPMDKFLVSCNVLLLGKTASKDIAKYCNWSMDNFLKKWKSFESIDGIGSEILNSIETNIDKICKNEQYIISFKKNVEKSKYDDGYTVVKKVAITGTLSKPRSYYIELIEKNGWKVASSISSTTHYLLCGDKAGSKKEKAEKLGITILTEAEFNDMIKKVS